MFIHYVHEIKVSTHPSRLTTVLVIEELKISSLSMKFSSQKVLFLVVCPTLWPLFVTVLPLGSTRPSPSKTYFTLLFISSIPSEGTTVDNRPSGFGKEDLHVKIILDAFEKPHT